VSAAVLAHAGLVTPGDWWRWDALGLSLVVLTVLLAVRGVRVATRRPGPSGRGHHLRVVAFWVGVTTIVVAVASPLHAVADALFAAHMVQHLLLITIGAPLVVRGAPAALGRPRPTDRLPTWSLVPATAALVVTFTLWHTPVLYEAAVLDFWVHTVEHASMLGAGLLFWASAAAAISRGHDLAALGAIGVSGLAGLALGALLALAPRPWYPVHLPGAMAWGIDPLADQQLGGMIMWIPGGSANLLAATIVIFRFLSRHEDPEAAVDSARPRRIRLSGDATW
jgi:putative membrane protein